MEKDIFKCEKNTLYPLLSGTEIAVALSSQNAANLSVNSSGE